jgi:hypothetical protein
VTVADVMPKLMVLKVRREGKIYAPAGRELEDASSEGGSNLDAEAGAEAAGRVTAEAEDEDVAEGPEARAESWASRASRTSGGKMAPSRQNPRTFFIFSYTRSNEG